MVKSARKSKSKSKSGKPKAPRALRRAVVLGRDKAAEAYLNLLIDPCNAPLAYPLYGGSDGSYLAKFESYFNVGSAAANGFLWWSPGTTCVTPKAFLVTGTNATPGGAITWASTGDLAGNEPGSAFLRTAATASSYRAVAACMEIVTLDSELNRQGQLAVGTVSNAAVYAQDTSVDKLSPLVQVSSRVPDSKVEVVWHPTDAAHMYIDGTAGVANQQIERHNGLLFTWVGLPATTAGFRIKLTMVAEWKPQQGKGIVAPAPPHQSRLGMPDVLEFVAQNAGRFIRIGHQAYGAFRAVNAMRNSGQVGFNRLRIRDEL